MKRAPQDLNCGYVEKGKYQERDQAAMKIALWMVLRKQRLGVSFNL